MMSGLWPLVANVLRVPVEQITDESAPATVGGWTSLAHLQLVKAVEDTYRVSLSPREIRGITCVGDIRACLRERGVEP